MVMQQTTITVMAAATVYTTTAESTEGLASCIKLGLTEASTQMGCTLTPVQVVFSKTKAPVDEWEKRSVGSDDIDVIATSAPPQLSLLEQILASQRQQAEQLRKEVAERKAEAAAYSARLYESERRLDLLDRLLVWPLSLRQLLVLAVERVNFLTGSKHSPGTIPTKDGAPPWAKECLSKPGVQLTELDLEVVFSTASGSLRGAANQAAHRFSMRDQAIAVRATQGQVAENLQRIFYFVYKKSVADALVRPKLGACCLIHDLIAARAPPRSSSPELPETDPETDPQRRHTHGRLCQQEELWERSDLMVREQQLSAEEVAGITALAAAGMVPQLMPRVVWLTCNERCFATYAASERG
jgi:hypothetical protein